MHSDRGDSVGRFALEIAFLDKEPGKHTEKIQVVVPRLSAIVALDEHVIEEVNAERAVELVDIVSRTLLQDILTHDL